LPHRRDRSGEAGQHAGIDSTDVDAEFERGGGDDADRFAAGELVFDLPSLGGEISRAIRADAPGEIVGKPRADIAATNSVALRLRQNVMVRSPSSISLADTAAASSSSMYARRWSMSSRGGLSSANVRGPRGDPSS
jgi:hypothetical protein